MSIDAKSLEIDCQHLQNTACIVIIEGKKKAPYLLLNQTQV